MNGDNGSDSRLGRLTRLNLSGAQQQIVDEYRGLVDELDVAELLVVAHAAHEVGDSDLMAQACQRVRMGQGDTREVMQLRMQLATLTKNRALYDQIAQSATTENLPTQGPALEEFLAALVRLHAWGVLAQVLSVYSQTEEPGYAVVMARALLQFRRRSFDRALLDAEAAPDLVPEKYRNAARYILAIIADRAGNYKQSGRNIFLIIDWIALNNRLSRSYKAGWIAKRAGRIPLAYRCLHLSERGGTSGSGVLRLRAELHVAREEYKQAEEAYQRLLDANPYDLDAALGMCTVFGELAEPDAVLEFVDQTLQRLDAEELHNRRIELLRALGQGPQADHEQSQLANRSAKSREATQIESVASDEHRGRAENVTNATFEAGIPPTDMPDAFRPQWTEAELSRSAGTQKALAVQWRVVSALLLREIKTRFGRLKLGYIWAFLEPLLHGGVMYLLWSFRGNATFDGHPLAVFLVLGLVPFFLFSETYSRLSRAVSSNQALLAHRQVTPFDVMLARAVLELLTRIAILFVYLVALVLVGFELTLDKPLVLLSTIVAFSLAGTSLGMTVQAYSSIMLSLPNLMTMVIRLLYLSSGVIFPLSLLPPNAQDLALVNPMAHLVQLTRNAFLAAEPIHGVTLVYPMICIFGLLLFGLLSLRAMQRRILSS